MKKILVIIAIIVLCLVGRRIFLRMVFMPAAPYPVDNVVGSVPSILRQQGWQVTQIWTSYEGDLPHASATRRTFAIQSRTPVQPVVTEYRIVDRDALRQALEGDGHQMMEIGSRHGYAHPIAGLVPSSAFVLIGDDTAVTVEYGLHGFGNLMDWSQNPVPQELIPMIDELQVH